MHLLDTDLIVGFLRNNEDAIKAVAALKPQGIGISAITMHELIDGAYRSSQKEKALETINELAKTIDVYDFDTDCSRISGKLKAELISKGSYPGEMDILIASVALRNGLKLVTRNKRNFENIPALHLKIW